MKLSRRRFLLEATAAGAALALGAGRPSEREHRFQLIASFTFIATRQPTGITHRLVRRLRQPVRGGRNDRPGRDGPDEHHDPGDAWRALIPAYTAGQTVAIKINLNNANCGDTIKSLTRSRNQSIPSYVG